MPNPNNKYCDYFDVDDKYWPCIDDAAIKDGAPWDNTYPHETFINMLSEMERALSRQNDGKTLWIDGAYGTGKSQCAHALRNILEVPETELRTYWERYEPLRKKTDLLEKLVGHRQKGIVTAYRFAAGGIMSIKDLCFAIQESIKAALVEHNVPYLGENTLKESIAVWLEDSDHKLLFDSLLKNPNKEWKALFSQSTADEVLDTINKGGEIKGLVNNIFRLADKEGITALTIDSDRLINWLTDIIDQNDIRVVLIWDEFSDFFRNNRESLSEFQKIASLVQFKPFYFIIITHDRQQIYVAQDDRGTQSKVSDRFISISIELPDNIAFNLLGHSFNVKPTAKQLWDVILGDLNNSVSMSSSKVMETIKINDRQVISDILPLHPVAALLLKYIAIAYKSNQRSMFDFIKTSKAGDLEAFQWFIENKGPADYHPLLTVDMLWDFFYEKGKDNLTSDVRLILDAYHQQRKDMREDEQAVLKAILIMQAIDQSLHGDIDLFKATEQNLSYVFEGISDLDGTKSAHIAKRLKDEGILITNQIDKDRFAYAIAVLAGDPVKIETYENEIRKASTTQKLVNEGELSTVLSLGPALSLRFESEPGTGKIVPVTFSSGSGDFKRIIGTLREKETTWKFHAVIAFAKNEEESIAFRNNIRDVVTDEQYKNIVFIDALSTPLGDSAFERYVYFSARAMYYQGNQNDSAKENAHNAKQVLATEWKNSIYNGQFIVYSFDNQEGEKYGNAEGVKSALQTIVTKKYRYIEEIDFARGIVESQLKTTDMKHSAKSGIIQNTSRAILGAEKNVLSAVWKISNYWNNPTTSHLTISKIKIEVDKFINDAFNDEGLISIGDIYDFLEHSYGFAPSNLSAFITGFLLKEYGEEPYRYSDSNGEHEPMTHDQLANMIGNYIGKSPKPTYIMKMHPDEMKFYELNEKVWDVSVNSCSSADQASRAIAKKMHDELKLPVWTLEEVDVWGVFDIVCKYAELVLAEGKSAHKIAMDIGKIANVKTSLADNLKSLLTYENCQKGMRDFLSHFEDGEIMKLAKDVGADSNVISDIRRLFEVKHSCLWDKQTGEDEIRKLISIYGVVKESNSILNTMSHSIGDTYHAWRERLKFVSISQETLIAKFPVIEKILYNFVRIYKQEELLPEQLREFYDNLLVHNEIVKELLNNEKTIFFETYKPYLEDIGDGDILEIKSMLPTGMFELSKTDCNIKVKEAAENFRKNQLKTQLVRLWKDKTGTNTPYEWSSRYRVPILSCVKEEDFERAKKTFETINRNWGTDAAIRDAIEFLETSDVFDILSDSNKRDLAFKSDIIGRYNALLPDIDRVRDSLERLSVDTYDWRDNPNVKKRVVELAKAEYESGGSDKVLSIIKKMDDSELKQFLINLVHSGMDIGVEILERGKF